MIERTEKLAIWLNDVERLPNELRQGLLGGRINFDKIHRVGQGEKNEEQPALEFTCPLLEAATVCDLVRSYNRKVGERPSEIYLNKTGEPLAWRRVVYSDALTIRVKGKTILNPKVFAGTLIENPNSDDLAAKPIRIGKR